MKTPENIRKQIIKSLFNNPILGKHYVDWYTADGKCGLTLMYNNANEKFDIIISKQIKEEF